MAIATDRLVSRLRIGMGTFIAVDAECECERRAVTAIDTAFAALRRVEILMHPTGRGSDVTRIGNAVPGAVLKVDPWTWEVLALCKRIAGASEGAFDPCLPDSAGTLDDLELLDDSCLTTHARLQIDLGGIAKGYGVDQGICALRACGCPGGLVNAGGDLAVFGRRSRQIVCSGIVISLRDAAVATSEVTRTARPPEHRGYYNGMNRAPITSGRIEVRAPTAALADALTKCCLIMQGEERERLLGAFAARLVSSSR